MSVDPVAEGGARPPPGSVTILEAVQSCSNIDYEHPTETGILPLLLQDRELVAHIGWIKKDSRILRYLLNTFVQEQRARGEELAGTKCTSLASSENGGGSEAADRGKEIGVSLLLDANQETTCANDESSAAGKIQSPLEKSSTGSPLAAVITFESPRASEAGTTARCSSAKDELKRRSAFFRVIAESLRSAGLVNGWRDEQYVVRSYSGVQLHMHSGDRNGSDCAASARLPAQDLGSIERAVTTLLGMPQFGVHANVFVRDDPQFDEPNYWIAQRSATKATWPSCWDTAVAGGLAYKENVRLCMVRECTEEAGIDAEKADADLRAASAVSFCCHFPPDNLFNDNDYVFDLRVPPEFKPVPEDGEVGSFECVSARELVHRITHLEEYPFLPSALLCFVDLLCRHGVIHADADPDYFQILRDIRKVPPAVDIAELLARGRWS